MHYDVTNRGFTSLSITKEHNWLSQYIFRQILTSSEVAVDCSHHSIVTCNAGITKEGITRWFHKLKKNLYIKNSIYFSLLVHRQEYRNELKENVSPSAITIISKIHPNDGIIPRNIYWIRRVGHHNENTSLCYQLMIP
jgi:hypothetical protein